ncbi:hypothetical protein NUW58_g8697 [Xylaria curta]|uniref:Uncharacterized protein n=1 Tax=Xylaria curta TaxID=42375 RepID=A0ACC1N748_9PEZI|nr:hypothetical protein NUW58_g8697 [Xylaria curta]
MKRDGDGGSSPSINTNLVPFTNALAAHLDHHLALDIFHPGLRVLRVVCDAFALSEGRMKVFAPPSSRNGDDGVDDVSATKVAVETFLRDLILRAQGREWSASARWLANMEATW